MDIPTREDIRGLCTEQSFQRGVNYHDEGRIESLDIEGESVQAAVRGSHLYEVSVELGDLRTHCTCPYDYAGACKHIVAVLLGVRQRTDEGETSVGAENSTTTTDAAALVDEMPAEELRAFLRDLVAENGDIRERFVAFAGSDTDRTVHDYRREIDQLFNRAAGRGGVIEYGTRIDFSKYDSLAETHRERGRPEEATAIYRALAEAIAENLERVDDSGGHYGMELERAVENYAGTVREHTDSHAEHLPHIEYLCDRYLDDEYGFVSDYYDDALRTVCATDADYEYWLELLDEQITGIDLTDVDPPAWLSAPATGTDNCGGSDTSGDDRDGEAPGDTAGESESSEETLERANDDILFASDFADGPLRVEEFTGGAFEVEHLAVGGLELVDFAGDAFEELRVDEPTTVERRTLDRESRERVAGDGTAAGDLGGTDTPSIGVSPSVSVSTRTLLASCEHVLEELDREATLLALYEHSYLESRLLCQKYAELLADRGREGRALDVLADGIETFRSTQSLTWSAADIYRERDRDGDDDRYRDMLTELFLDHGDWDAYRELKETACEEEWTDVRGEFVDTLETRSRQAGSGRRDERRLVKLFLSDGETERAFELVVERADLDWLKRYRDDVAGVDPERYFETYREQLVPFAANDTGRKHYRKIADHLEELRAIGLDERFEEFRSFLKQEHSNRPAFLDELETAGF